MLDAFAPSSTRFHRCTRCAADLSTLSAAARFCPKCGLRLSDHRATLSSATFTPLQAFSSCVLQGYANAMFRLGVHYEVRHNDDEAVRCYGKASRLGLEEARGRLDEIPFASRSDEPSDGARAASARS